MAAPKTTKVTYRGPDRYFPHLGRVVVDGDRIDVDADSARDHPETFSTRPKTAVKPPETEE